MQQGDVRAKADDSSEDSAEDSNDDSASTEGWLQAAAGCKHLLAYDLERSNGTDRFHFDAQISRKNLMEWYLPMFKACVEESRPAAVMCALNAVNGVPSCANPLLQNTVMREQWGFDGYVVSDW